MRFLVVCFVTCITASFVVSGNSTTAPSLPLTSSVSETVQHVSTNTPIDEIVSTSTDGPGISAMDAVISFHLGHLENVSRIIDLPDMRNETTKKYFFVRVKRVMVATNVRLRLPTKLDRVSPVTVESDASECNFTFDMALGNMTSWGKYDVKVGGVGPNGDFTADISGRVVRVTVRYREVNDFSCGLWVVQLLVEQPGKWRMPLLPDNIAAWAADAEDIKQTQEVMRDLLNAEIVSFPCDKDFIKKVRRECGLSGISTTQSSTTAL